MNSLYVLALKVYNLYVFGLASLRYRFWKMFIRNGGTNVYILDNCRLLAPKGISFGNNIYINHHTEIDGHGKVIIGSNVMIGPYCAIYSAEHGFRKSKTPMIYQPITKGCVIIHDDVWIGSHTVILLNTNIGQGAVIGANSVVTRSIPPYAIAAGSPARIIKYRTNRRAKK